MFNIETVKWGKQVLLALPFLFSVGALAAEQSSAVDDSSLKGPSEVAIEVGAGYLLSGTVDHSVIAKSEQHPPLHLSVLLDNFVKAGEGFGVDLQFSGLFNPVAEQGIVDLQLGASIPLGAKGPRLRLGLGAQRSLSESPIGLYTRYGYYGGVVVPFGNGSSFEGSFGGFYNTDVSFPAPEGPSYRLVFSKDFLASASVTHRFGKLKLSAGGELFYLGAAAVASDSFYSKIESDYVPRVFVDLRLPLAGAFYVRGRATYEINRDEDASFDRVLRAYVWKPNLMGKFQADLSAGWVFL